MTNQTQHSERRDGERVWSMEDVFNAVADKFGQIGVVQVRGTITAWRASKHRWVRAELATLNSDGNATGKLSVAVRPGSNFVGGPVHVGADVVITGTLVTHPLYSPLQLQATRVQVLAEEAETLGVLRDHLAALKTSDQLNTNKYRSAPDPITRIGLVTPSSGGAGYNDPIAILNNSPIHITAQHHAVAMMGPAAAREIAAAVSSAGIGNDVVLLCRGGGATTDLSAFNSVEVVNAIVGCGAPVIAGVGHAHDSTAADLVAHVSAETPTAAAGWVLAANRRSKDLADQSALAAQQEQARHVELVAQQEQARHVELVAQRQLGEAAANQQVADKRVRLALSLVAVALALALATAFAVWALIS